MLFKQIRQEWAEQVSFAFMVTYPSLAIVAQLALLPIAVAMQVPGRVGVNFGVILLSSIGGSGLAFVNNASFTMRHDEKITSRKYIIRFVLTWIVLSFVAFGVGMAKVHHLW